MKNFAVIKGIKKFADSSVSKQLDLSPFSVVYRNKLSKSTGISTQTFGNFWFLTPKGQALFKTYDSIDFCAARNIRIINELVCMELLKKIGISCAEYEPAKFRLATTSAPEIAQSLKTREKAKPGTLSQTFDGLVTYNFLSLGETLTPLGIMLDMNAYCEPSLEYVSKKLGELQKQGFKVSRRKIILSLYALSVFDFLTKQTDRNSHNINVIQDELGNIRPAKVIDNEFAFFGQYFSSRNMKIDEHDLADMIHFHNLCARNISMQTLHSESCPKRLKTAAEDIVAYAKIHPEMRFILISILKKLDIDDAVKKTREKGVQISPEYHEFMKTVVEDGKTQLTNLMRMKISKTILEDFDELF